MAYISDLENKIQDYLEGDYEIIEAANIPSVENVTLGKKAYKIKLTTFCIDLRKSTDLLRIHDKETCGKIHKSYLTITSKIIAENKGQLRSFNGDSILAFWPAQFTSDIEMATRAAFQIKWALDIKFAPLFSNYTKLDFGIGIDWGDVYIVKAGLPRNDNNNDLVFLGISVNFATMIANQASGPSHIEISSDIYSNLTDDWIFGVYKGTKTNMWTNGKVNWKGKEFQTKCTSWYQEVKE